MPNTSLLNGVTYFLDVWLSAGGACYLIMYSNIVYISMIRHTTDRQTTPNVLYSAVDNHYDFVSALAGQTGISGLNAMN